MPAGVDAPSKNASYGVVGTARLPRAVAGEQAAPLMIELLIDSHSGTIIDVAVTIQLPGYQALLQRLVGSKLVDVEAAGRALFARYRGPLVRPTLAALANAVANAQDVANGASPQRSGRGPAGSI